jgi:hypothetical protein
LNSPRCSRLTNDRDSRSSYPSILTEKDIPDEGNARRIDEHQTKSKNFQMSGSKNKRITNTKFSFKTKNQLGMNNSYDQNKWFNFDEARYSKTKSTMIGPSKLKQSRTRKNLDENIEPENSEKIININSSENFCPGIDKVKEKPESKWSFWNTLKNPIQWLGLKSSHTNTPVKDKVNKSQEQDMGRNRSISYHVYDAKKGKVIEHMSYPAEVVVKHSKTTEKTNYSKFSKSMRSYRNEKVHYGDRSLKYLKKI